MDTQFQIWLIALAIGSLIVVALVRFLKNGFSIVLIGLVSAVVINSWFMEVQSLATGIMKIAIPLQGLGIIMFAMKGEKSVQINKSYRAVMQVNGTRLVLQNIRRGISIIASAGSGKTESVIYNLLLHFKKEQFCGVIHDYKDFEISEIAYPLFRESANTFYIVSFDPIYSRVNPIAPRYLPDEESVYEVSRVLLENLLEVKEADGNSTSRFFKDAVEGLISGLIWRLRTDYEDYCTIPHLIALYQQLTTKGLLKFLKGNITSRAMADAFISGIGSERQTAGVKSTLANAFKKITTRKIFMVLSADDIPLNINNPDNPAIVSIVNNPKKDASLSPVIATIMHTITKQMSERKMKPSFVLMEEASTLRMLNMPRIPATLRSYNIATIYVLQDKIQNDILYGDKAGKAILSNLSYQFFGKANDPDTARYYESFFEIVKNPTRSISKGTGWSWEARVTKGEREVPKRRAEIFYKLKQGEFIVFSDGKDRRIRFAAPKIHRDLPSPKNYTKQEINDNFNRIHNEVKTLFAMTR